MTPEAQRIAIAEACGWTAQERPHFTGFTGWFTVTPTGSIVGHSKTNQINVAAVPDYLNDLNAMHEAEKVCIYAPHCALGMLYSAQPTIAGFISATAAQRAEAFLRTLGLYKDTQ